MEQWFVTPVLGDPLFCTFCIFLIYHIKRDKMCRSAMGGLLFSTEDFYFNQKQWFTVKNVKYINRLTVIWIIC